MGKKELRCSVYAEEPIGMFHYPGRGEPVSTFFVIHCKIHFKISKGEGKTGTINHEEEICELKPVTLR